MSKSFLPEGIQRWPIERWTNGHENFTAKFKKDSSFKLVLPDSLATSSEKYRATTANFKWLIQYAIDHNIQLRAMGNGWSFSEVAISEGGVVDTKSLRLSFAFNDSFVAPEYLAGHSSKDLFLVQCGMSILQIHEKLQAAGRSLKACGASNGQSIAGAISTGTHGSAFRIGAVHDSVLGIHLVTGPDTHVWLERSSNPVASDQFISWLGATKISDDVMFNASLVSFGAFGFIHSLLLETETLFLLEEHKTGEKAYDAGMTQTMNTLDFSFIEPTLPYPQGTPGKDLYHFEVLVNPHDFEKDNPEKGIFPKLIYKTPYRHDYPKRPDDAKPFVYGDNTLGLIQTILDTLGPTLSAPLIPRLVNAMLPLINKPGPAVFATMGETFKNTKFRGKAASAAFAINAADSSKVLDIILNANKSQPFAGATAFRYVKGTKSLLGFTKFPLTAVVEMDGVDSKLSRRFFQTIWEKLEEENIPFTLHWGKINFFLTPERIRKMYGEETIQQWIQCRHALLNPATRKVFNNRFMANLGLTV